MMKRTIALAAALLAAAGCIAAGKPGVRVEDAWARATPAVAPVAGGYLTAVNDGDAPDVLLGVESGIAQRVEIHEMRMQGGMMRMRRVEDGVPVPAHGKAVLAPGGYHLMFIQPRRALVEGERFEATLVFRNAGRVKTQFAVRAMGAGAH
jgi:copper(I)-binding protein